MPVNKYYRYDERKPGNQIVWSHLDWAIHLKLSRAVVRASPFLCVYWLPPVNTGDFFLCCSERERAEEREGGEDKNKIGAEHNGEQCSAFSIPFY